MKDEGYKVNNGKDGEADCLFTEQGSTEKTKKYNKELTIHCS
ncbi:hypothetical protein SAMN06297397_0090 [Aristaeella lactis]|uniref:Uncharacterized protein n=1 Tax=Aristaeella lactis TaxID=3046383 RepID=A0AC61PQS8_9FIRM|nr:hypothetical protein SAMN06297397_0090 [Aristaeella lactis]